MEKTFKVGELIEFLKNFNSEAECVIVESCGKCHPILDSGFAWGGEYGDVDESVDTKKLATTLFFNMQDNENK